MTLEAALQQIRPADQSAFQAVRAHWDSLAKPLGSLGELERAVARIGAATGNADVHLNKRTLLVFCADNGVVAQGVSQSGPEVTAAVATALGAGTSTVNYLARGANCRVVPVDLGILDFPGAPGVENHRVRNGTGDISQGPALTRAECVRAIETGIELVGREAQQGTDVVLLGEMGIGNTTTSSALACGLLNLPATELTGRGAGLSDEGLRRKIAAIQRAFSVNAPDVNAPVDLLSKVGGLDLAGLCGACIGGALYRLPVLLDGLITAAAALCAVRLCPAVGDYLLASHVSAEPAAHLLLEALKLHPLISAGMRLGEGSGAVCALPLLDLALEVYHSGHTFGHLGIEAYTPQ